MLTRIPLISVLAVAALALSACTAQTTENGDPVEVADAWTSGTSGSAPGEDSCKLDSTQEGSLPDPACTPGAITRALKPTDLAPVCSALQQVDAKVPAKTARAVFAAYGISGSDSADYVAAYLIPPAIGGANDYRNIWPMPQGDSTSTKKQLVDSIVSNAVCGQRAGIQAAQYAVASDWTAATDTLRLGS